MTAEELARVLRAARSPTTRSRATSASLTSSRMTVTGKVQKFLMREHMTAELGVRAATTA